MVEELPVLETEVIEPAGVDLSLYRKIGEEVTKIVKHKPGMLCDGFAGYETAFKPNPDVRQLNCLVHIRRHFEQSLDENKEMAEHGLTQIQHIYRIEHCCDKAVSYDERKAKLWELAGSVMDAMKVWMETEGIRYSPIG